MASDGACVRVAVRVRPIDAVSSYDGDSNSCSVCSGEQVTLLDNKKVAYSATYDYVFDQDSRQEDIFERCALPLGYDGLLRRHPTMNSIK